MKECIEEIFEKTKKKNTVQLNKENSDKTKITCKKQNKNNEE